MKKLLSFLTVMLSGVLLMLPASAADGSLSDDTTVIKIVVAVIIGILLALGIVFLMKRSMSTVRYQKRADGYVNDGSFSLTDARDIYLYSTVSRTRINNDNNRR